MFRRNSSIIHSSVDALSEVDCDLILFPDFNSGGNWLTTTLQLHCSAIYFHSKTNFFYFTQPRRNFQYGETAKSQNLILAHSNTKQKYVNVLFRRFYFYLSEQMRRCNVRKQIGLCLLKTMTRTTSVFLKIAAASA